MSIQIPENLADQEIDLDFAELGSPAPPEFTKPIGTAHPGAQMFPIP